MRHFRLLLLGALLSTLFACIRPDPDPGISPLLTPTRRSPAVTPTLAPTTPATAVNSTPLPSPTVTVPATETPRPDATPFILGAGLVPCGVEAPLVAAAPASVDITPRSITLPDDIPDEIRPALQYLLDNPGRVSLAAYRLNDPANGAYLNPDLLQPVASVAKIITLIAYAEAVSAGDLNPDESVPLETLADYYLPRTDLNAHQQAMDAMAAEGRLSGERPSLRLDDIVLMMMRYSSNAAADYLHFRIGQARVEAQLTGLDIGAHTAPCPFLGQFLLMGHHLRSVSNRESIQAFAADSEQYGVAVVALADLYRRDATFRAAETAARRQGRRPSFNDQRLFTTSLSTRASAATYAALMGRLAQNGLADPNAAFHVRRHLEWPMQFEENQAQFYNLGYKGGALPGALAVTYYAYTKVEAAPFVAALFFHPLPDATYRQWQRSQSHDALARWLVGTPGAIERLRRWLNNEAG